MSRPDPPLRRAHHHAQIRAGHRPNGPARCTSRRPATPTHRPLTAGSFCTGYGGLDQAAEQVLESKLTWYAENDRHASTILAHRYPGIPNLGDLTQLDVAQVPPVDLITAGFPCQDISFAGRGAGIKEGTRSGLWITIAQAVHHLRPGLLFLENVAALRTRGLGRVLGDLAEIGYDAAWTSVRASDAGAPHRRERVFILAVADSAEPGSPQPGRPRPAAGGGPAGEPSGRGVLQAAADPGCVEFQRRRARCELGATPGARRVAAQHAAVHRDTGVAWREYEPAIRRWEHHVGRAAPHPIRRGAKGGMRLAAPFVEWMMGLDEGHVTSLDIPHTAKMRALGNGVVPQQAALALRQLLDMHAGSPPE
jgi:DNA (cytosine-5)-methyltransferase 1